MKKLLAIVFGVTMGVQGFAQWQPNGATSGNIYYNGGNVGIGVSPQADLHISRANTSTNLLIENTQSATNTFPGININNYRGAGLGHPYIMFNNANGSFATPTALSSSLLGALVFGGHNGSGFIQAGRIEVQVASAFTATSTPTNILFSTTNTNATSYSEKMRITSEGFVGVGTVSPQQKLHVSNGAIMASDLSFNTINVRVDGTSIPALRFTRWTGGVGTVQHNAFAGQFQNSSRGNEYSFGIGTGISSTGDQNFSNMVLTATQDGNVGIGNTNPDAKLTVSGQVHAQEVKVTVNAPGPDYVFEKDYALPSLDQIKNYIEENKHLPEVPSAKEMEKNGVQLGEMNMLLLKKIEELTLYVIELKRRDEVQQREIEQLKANK
jgi:hypothetical protein